MASLGHSDLKCPTVFRERVNGFEDSISYPPYVYCSNSTCNIIPIISLQCSTFHFMSPGHIAIFITHDQSEVMRSFWLSFRCCILWLYVQDVIILMYGTWSHVTKFSALCVIRCSMMTSSNGDIFRVTGHLCGEFTGHRWFPTQRPVTRSFDVFFDLHLN